MPSFPLIRPRPPTGEAPPRGLRIAHRAGLGHAPENSLEAIECAAELGADAVELDIRLVGEQLICAHDAGQPGPLAGDALELARSRGLRIELDLKGNGRDGSVPAVAGLLSLMGTHDHTWVSTFHPLTAWRLRMADRRLVVGWSIATSPVQRIPLWSGWARWLGAQVLAPEVPLVTPSRVRAWTRMGFVLETWSVPLSEEERWLAQGVSVVLDRLRA